MRPGAERDALGEVARESNFSASSKCASSRFAEPNMKKTRSSGASATSPIANGLGDATRRHANRRDPARIFLEHVEPRHLARRAPAVNWSGCISSAHTQPATASRGSFWPPEIASLMLARTLSIGMPAAIITPSRLKSSLPRSCGIRSSIAASIPAVAAWQRASTRHRRCSWRRRLSSLATTRSCPESACWSTR